MKPRAWLAAALAAACLFVAFGAWRYAAGLGPKRAAREYVLALARGDARAAQNVALGSAAYAAAGLQGEDVRPAEVRSVDAYLSTLGRGWALVEAEAELVLSDGTADVGWYRLELVKADGGWKVVDFRPVAPRLSGVGLAAWGRDAGAAGDAFTEYLRLLAQGRYAEAARLAVGPARAAQEREIQVLGKAPLFKEVSEVSARPLWRRGKYLALAADYRVDGRTVSVVVLMYRTKQGWRIAGVSEV